ncbi:MAG: class I SAM-dependent methyltransferase [Chthoniobacterales bacterium]
MTDKARSASKTALAVAYLRAAHQLLDAKPLIFDDPVALKLLGDEGRPRIEANKERYSLPAARGLRSHVVLRSRFAEDRLEQSVARGINTYVILGAGFDTFAYRQPQWAHDLRIIEVDHPESQAAKRARLARAGIDIPSNVQFADIDFEHETLDEGFRRHGISLLEKTFFSWLGVTVYLTEEAVEDVFREIARFPSGSEIAFTFSQPPEKKTFWQKIFGRPSIAKMAAKAGEPWLTYYEPEKLRWMLSETGFPEVYFLTPDASRQKYFADHRTDIPVPRRTSIASAIR